MPRSAGAARQKALAQKKAKKEEEQKAKEVAEAQRKADAQAKKKAAKNTEADADADGEKNDGDAENDPPVTPKGKGKGKKAAPKGKTPRKAKAVAPKMVATPKKAQNAADNEEDEGPPATPTGKGKGKKAAAKKAATPKKTQAPKKAVSPKKAAPAPKRAEKAAPVAAPVAGRKRTSGEMLEGGNNGEHEDDDADDPRPAKNPKGPQQPQQPPQPPAKKAKTVAGFPQGGLMTRKTASNPNANHRKQLAGNNTFLIPRKTAPRTGGNGERSHGNVRRSNVERWRENWERQRNERRKKKSPPVGVRVSNGMGGVREREVRFDENEDDNSRPRSGWGRGGGREEEEEEEEDDDERLGRGRGRGRGRGEDENEDENRNEELEEEARLLAERQEAEAAEARAELARMAAEAREAAEAAGAAQAAAEAAEAAARGARVAAGGNPDDDGDGDPDNNDGDDDDNNDDDDDNGDGGGGGPSDPTDNSPPPSITSEELQRHMPDIEGDERISSRLAQLKESLQTRRNRAQADGLPYTQGIFSRATGEKYGDPVILEDLKRDFGYLKFLVQKFVSKVPTDERTDEELKNKVPSVWAEMKRITRHARAYWRTEPSPLRKWLLEALVWRRLHKVMFDRQYSEYFAFGHGKAILAEFWVTSIAAASGDFEEATTELCEQKARLATFLKEMYEKESPSRVARACEVVFVNGILDFFRERYIEYEEDDRYFFEERAERERELQDLAVQIITHAGDFQSRMLRSKGNWALIYRDPRDEEKTYNYPFAPDKMHLRVLEDEYVASEDPTGHLGDIQPDEEGKYVRLAITPGLWDFLEWAESDPYYSVPHVRSEVSIFRQLPSKSKKGSAAGKLKKKDSRRRGRR